jgi:alkanesulfonate monooxygenase SsuD/methylene tetrahydromethanopterin reductase-like flavin-dependent oxidoreductase (luciferase family)
VGWHETEFGLMGVPYRERGPRTSEAIEVLKALWAGDDGGVDHVVLNPLTWGLEQLELIAGEVLPRVKGGR